MSGTEPQKPPTAAAPQQNAPEGAAPAQGPAAAAAKAQIAAEKAKKALSNLKNLGVWATVLELARDLFDPDRRTRKMALYFVLSVTGIVVVLISSGVYFNDLRRIAQGLSATGEQSTNFGQFLKKQADEAKRKYSTQSLGSFTVELKTAEAEGKEPVKRPPGVMNLAEVEIIVECDDKTTCEFIEDRMPAVRNELTDIFTAMDREELLSRDGKRKLKDRIMSKLNYWLPKGKIQNLYFNKLVIS